MASQSHGAAQQDHELSDLQIYCYERPRRIKIKKSYKEFASDEENSEMAIGAEDAKKRRIKGRWNRKKRMILSKRKLSKAIPSSCSLFNKLSFLQLPLYDSTKN